MQIKVKVETYYIMKMFQESGDKWLIFSPLYSQLNKR